MMHVNDHHILCPATTRTVWNISCSIRKVCSVTFLVIGIPLFVSPEPAQDKANETGLTCSTERRLPLSGVISLNHEQILTPYTFEVTVELANIAVTLVRCYWWPRVALRCIR
jgi:hypothetical protein